METLSTTFLHLSRPPTCSSRWLTHSASGARLIISAYRAHHLRYIRNQMASMLHALSSTFTTCACGSKAKDCALNLMAEFVDGRLPTSSAPLSQRPDALNGGDKRPPRIDLGPLIGAQRGFRTCEKSPLNGGMNGVEMISALSVKPAACLDASRPLSKGRRPSPPSHIKEKAPVVQATTVTPSPNDQSEGKGTQEGTNTRITPELGSSSRGHELRDTVMYRSPSLSDSDPQPHSEDEEQMPPKMRKRWIHRSTDGLRSASPFPSSCDSNDSLGSVLDESQMSLEPSGVHAMEL
jgi:uncharacterized protein